MQRTMPVTQQRGEAQAAVTGRRDDRAAAAHRFPVQVRATFRRLPRREDGAHR